MSYTALARKWRPKRFTELVGQEHVLQALANALDAGRVHHAFLFTGTRGVGKTTIARILAKCLNCEIGVSSNPCGVCAACREIDEGRFVDLIEVDAASRTKVDDTRELLDNVQYAPTRGRYKVYLIDEVHMLSAHSLNALLKTLEEPPAHVKFLLATTDPQKLPITVLSRCLQFNLKRLPVALIAERLRVILEAEGIGSEGAALRLLAQAADGSLRDALSLLDQLIAFAGGHVTEAHARAMLGTVDHDHVVRLAEALAAQDGTTLLALAGILEERAFDYAQVLDELATLLQRIAMRQAVPDYGGDELHPAELLDGLAARLDPEDVQLFYQTAILGRRDLALAPDPRTGFEMTLIRMLAFRAEPPPEAAPRSSAGNAASGPRAAAAAGDSAAQAPGSPAAAPENAPAPRGEARAPAGVPELSAERWAAVVAELDLQGAARQLAANCAFAGRDGPLVRLELDGRHQLMRTRAQEEKLAQALSRYLGEAVRLEFAVAAGASDTPAETRARLAQAALEEARRSLELDPNVRALQERFGAALHAESVRPHQK